MIWVEGRYDSQSMRYPPVRIALVAITMQADPDPDTMNHTGSCRVPCTVSLPADSLGLVGLSTNIRA